MPDLGPITRKLSALASDRSQLRDGLRVLSNGVFPAPLPAILDEIDATVLRRELTFSAGESRVVLTVAGRRILGVVALSDDMAGWQSLVGQPLSQDDPPRLEQTGTLLATLASGERPVLLDVQHPTDAGIAVGISADHLRDLLEQGEPPRPVQLFIESCEPWYAACLFRSGGVWIGHSDDQALLARLRRLAEAREGRFRATYDGADPSSATPRLLILEAALDGGLSVTATWTQEDFAIFAHVQADAAHIHRAWRRIFTL